nr:uncharacterized protein LOC117859787 [Setaria viridis]
MEKVEDYFKGSSKANASTLLTKLMNTKYDGQGSEREHIMSLVDLRDKLNDMNCPLNDETLLHHIMLSLPSVFEPFKINYNGSDTKWDIPTLIAKCSQEGERLRSRKGNLTNLMRHEVNKGKNKQIVPFKKIKKPHQPPPKNDGSSSSKGPKCHQCVAYGHIKKHCEKFKEWCIKNDYKKGDSHR